MAYAQVTETVITEVRGRLPSSARRLDTSEWVLGLDDAPAASVEACGWYEVTETAPEPDTATTTHDRTVQLVGGVPTVVWVERAKTDDERAADDAQAKDTATRDQARTAFQNNKEFLAATGVNNAQVLAQVRDLTRQMNSMIRLVVDAGLIE